MADVEQHTSSPSSENQPVYYEISPTLTWVLRGIGLLTTLMVVLAFIFCLVQGRGNHTVYLQACNIVISAIVGIVNTWWYRKGDLPADKYWYMFIVGGVIMFQCLTTDIYVFNAPNNSPEVTTTPIASSTTTHAP